MVDFDWDNLVSLLLVLSLLVLVLIVFAGNGWRMPPYSDTENNNLRKGAFMGCMQNFPNATVVVCSEQANLLRGLNVSE